MVKSVKSAVEAINSNLFAEVVVMVMTNMTLVD